MKGPHGLKGANQALSERRRKRALLGEVLAPRAPPRQAPLAGRQRRLAVGASPPRSGRRWGAPQARPRPHLGHAGRASALRDAVASSAASRRAVPRGRLGAGPAACRSLLSPLGAARPPAAGSPAAPQWLWVDRLALFPATRRRGARASGGGGIAVVEARPARPPAARRSQCTSAGAERTEPRRAGRALRP